MNIFHSVAELAGNTPLLELCRYEHKHGLNARILAKLECCNVAGSAKDRVAKHMIERAEAEGKLVPGSVIIEPTSGNTGIGLAAMAKVHGYRVILTMPETMSVERRNLLKAYGAELVLTDGALGMKGAIAKAEELAAGLPNSFIPGQFANPANPAAHFRTTGPEIWNDTEGKADIFVAGVGTGGTITGVGKYLKSRNPDIRVVAVEPFSSPVLTQGTAGPHKIQGIGAGFVPETLDTSVYDEVITVTNEDAFATGKELARTDGVLALCAHRRETPERVLLRAGETVRWGGFAITCRKCEKTVENSENTVILRGAALDAPLSVGAWDARESMTLPVSRGSRSLKRLFAERGFSPDEREQTPVIRSGGAVAAVYGIGTDALFLPGDGESVCVLTFEKTAE
mgnify:CR=1 FL=1